MKTLLRMIALALISFYGYLVFAEATSSSIALQKTAVGYFRTNNNNLSPLSYTTTNGGATWSLSAALSLPNDVAANGVQNSLLQSVACNAKGLTCSTVGYYLTKSNNLTPFSYTSVNGGVNWSLGVSLPLPSNVAANGAQNSELFSVACDSTGGHCVAVGFYLTINNNFVPLSYTSLNGGKTWSLSNSLTLPSDIVGNGAQNSALLGVACDSTGYYCNAVGYYLNINKNIVPLSYTTTNGGTSWALGATLPLPSNVAANGSQTSRLQSVDCDHAGMHCSGIGFYLSINNNIAPLSYTSINGGASWTLSETLPLPSNVAANGFQNSKLLGVSCDNSDMHCNAIGYYLNTSNNIVPLSYTTINGGSNWALNGILPLPADVAANGAQNSTLKSTGCDITNTYCSAVGVYLNTNNNYVPLSYVTLNGGTTWSVSATVPLPANVAAKGAQNSPLLGNS